MAEETIILKTEVELGNSTNSVKSLKAELRQVTNELATLEEGSAAFVNAAKRAGELKDKIGDVKNTINAFNPEKKFQAIGDAVGIAANGFAAMQGAMALMGSESKELNKVIAQTQGAIALATGLNGLLGMGDAFKNLKLVAKDALLGIKTAIGATGIGLFVIAAGLIYANWEKLSKLLKDTFPIFNDMGKVFDKIREMAYGAGEVIKNALLMPFKTLSKVLTGDFKGALEEIKNGYNIIGNYEKGAEKGREANRQAAAEDRLKKLIEEKEKELEVHKAAGKDTYKEELALNKLKQQAAKDNAEELAKLLQAEKVLIAGHQKDLAAKAKAEAEKQKAEAKKKAEELKSFRDAEAAYDKEQLDKKLAREKEYKQQEDDYKQYIYEQKLLDDKEEIEKENKKNQEIADNEKATAEERYLALDALNKAGVISDKEASDAKIAIAQAEKDAKLNLLDAYGQTLGQVAELVGKNTETGKVMAIAATTIDTYVAAFRAYAEGLKIDPTGTFSIIAAAAAAATGFKAVQSIINTPVPNSGGGGGGGSTPSMPAAPAMRPTGFSTGQPSQIPPKVEPQKVYVVESDITNTQKKVSRIESKATIQ